MKKIILNPNICIDEIETIIKKQGWKIIEKKYDYYQSYISTFDDLHYEAKIDLYIAFKTTSNFIHKIYCYFLEFDSDNIFKISEIKSLEHPQGQMTTRIADFKYYKTTGNLGFSPYKSPVFGQKYNLSHNYHSFFNSLIAKETANELNYVCILLKYDNHAQSKKLLRYYVNSYKNFIKSFLLKLTKFERRKTRALLKAEISKKQKHKNKLNKTKIAKSTKNKVSLLKSKVITPLVNYAKKTILKMQKKAEKKAVINEKTLKVKPYVKQNITEPNNTKTVVGENNVQTIFDHKNMTVKVIDKTTNNKKNYLKTKK